MMTTNPEARSEIVLRASTATLLLTGCMLSCAACGGADTAGLDPAEVENIGPGNASGQAFSGVFELEVRTVACDGSCSASTGLFTASLCDVGDVDYETVLINQHDGVLQVEWSEPVSRLRGGIDANGSYEVGGYGTQSGGDLEISVRVDGAIDGPDLTGTARSWSVGAIDDDRVDCVGDHEITGSRPYVVDDEGVWREACYDDDDCASTLCNDQLHRCGPLAPIGGPCALDDDCASDECDESEGVCEPQ